MADETKPVVTFLGPIASYTHQACLETFAPEIHTLTPCITIEDVFSSVQSSSAFRGIVPFENSTNGSVVFTLDLFADLAAKYPDILVCGESYIAVQHCLLGHDPRTFDISPNPKLSGKIGLASVIESPLSSGAVTPTTKDPAPRKPRTAPIADISHIWKIYSHPQAWGQCKTFLDTYLKGVERQDVSSTSRAAQLVAEDRADGGRADGGRADGGRTAAISSLIAARMHGLDVLAKGIEDRSDNTTRFFVLRRATPSEATSMDAPAQQETQSTDEDEKERKEEFKTLVSFTVDHANPGALAHSLAVFERYGLNLTSINTRPSGVENWNYSFFVEIKGRKMAGDEDGDVNKALQELGKVARGYRWLGSWENRLAS
ncbi:PDT-domain-containing protein [Polyplosphaeria fusca]|uniref:prephenate dehydratase n=1 Tax=Polyplosphaeria fusca TaxID=682080 RepID=A0A9P4QQA7_9PLEO|nr:PDT-domain-containing protein [Polyplosphaeria fusca]